MSNVDSKTPVIIGVGFHQNHADDPAACPEAWRLMELAVKNAAEDAGDMSLLSQLESISVEQGMWAYRNPGLLLAEALGAVNARSVLADLGVLQMTPLFNVFDAIRRGEQSLGVVTGGEAKYRELRAKITGTTVSETTQDDSTPAPDVYHPTPDPFATEAESRAGIFLPVQLFAVIESALRRAEGLSVDAHRDQLAQLYAQFNDVAAQNPHAWNRQRYTTAAIRDPVEGNAMVAFPYTKRHASQWNVNQSVAILVSSVAKARELGVPELQWIYPQAAAQSRHVVCLAEQRSLISHPGTVMAGDRVYELAGISPEQVNAAELYSCFPAAVRSFARDLRLPRECPLSVTGSMAFAGGPYNHGALDGVARMVEVLRGDTGLDTSKPLRGLTTNLSGIFGKQAVSLFSNRPREGGYAYEDITEAVAAVDTPVVSRADYSGLATVLGYTVAYHKGELSQGFAYCESPDGVRCVANSGDRALLERMTKEEFVGRELLISAEGQFTQTD